MLSFKHSGDLGDIIYAMAVIRAMGGGFLHLTYKNHGVRESMTEQKARSVASLLVNQQYIKGWKFEPNDRIQVNHDFDNFRRHLGPGISLLDAQFRLMDLEPDHSPWLTVPPEVVAPVVFARSARYHSREFNWKKIYERWGRVAVFVGTRTEHEAFEKAVGSVIYYPTTDLWSLAQVISGCSLMVANQSCPLAIGLGIGTNIIMEEFPNARDCHLRRENLWFTVEDGIEGFAPGG